MKEQFHTKTEKKGDYEIRYIAGEDFVEMGSIEGEQYLSALYFCKMYEKSYSGELLRDEIEFLKQCVDNFIKNNNLNIEDKYPHYNTSSVEFYQKKGWRGYTSLLVTIIADYTNIWIRIDNNISHQTLYPEHLNPFWIDLDTLLCGIKRFYELSDKYLTERF